jgi:hypothetical protein
MVAADVSAEGSRRIRLANGFGVSTMHGGKMRESDALLSLRRFEITQKMRKVASLESMIIDCENIAAGLAQQIAAEENCTRNKDTRHVAYSTFAMAAAVRRSKLLSSVTDMKAKLDVTKRELYELATGTEELAKQLRDFQLAQDQQPSLGAIATRDGTPSNKPRPMNPGATAEVIGKCALQGQPRRSAALNAAGDFGAESIRSTKASASHAKA